MQLEPPVLYPWVICAKCDAGPVSRQDIDLPRCDGRGRGQGPSFPPEVPAELGDESGVAAAVDERDSVQLKGIVEGLGLS